MKLPSGSKVLPRWTEDSSFHADIFYNSDNKRWPGKCPLATRCYRKRRCEKLAQVTSPSYFAQKWNRLSEMIAWQWCKRSMSCGKGQRIGNVIFTWWITAHLWRGVQELACASFFTSEYYWGYSWTKNTWEMLKQFRVSELVNRFKSFNYN